MTEYDFSPGAYAAYQQKLAGVGSWAKQVSKYEPVNPFVAPTDRDSDFYKKGKSGTRSKSSSTPNNHRKSKSSVSHKRRGYTTDIADSESSTDEDGPDRPPTPTGSAPMSYGYGGLYGNPAVGGVAPRQAAWPASGGRYISPPPVQYPQPQRPQAPIVISNTTGQPLIPTFNPLTRVWEYHEQPSSSSRPPRSSRKSKRRGRSVPPGLGQMLPGVGGFIYPGSSPTPSQPMLSPPPSGPYSGNQPTMSMSAMYLPSGHTSPASIQYSLPQTAPAPQSSLQAQQQQALQARYHQQQQQQARGTAPVIPIMTGVSVPMMHMQGFSHAQQPMMSPPLTGMTTTYTGYPGASTTANMGYLTVSNASMTSAGQPMANVVVDSGKKTKEKDSGSGFFGMLGRKKR